MFEPNGEVSFIHCDEIDPTQNIFLDFKTQQEQEMYFNSKILPGKAFVNCTPQGVDGFSGAMRAPGSANEYDSANYCTYKNKNGKLFYAYLGVARPGPSSGMCIIPYTVDIMRTYYFDFGIDMGMVEREHASNDTPGSNIIPESVETGEFVSNTREPFQFTGSGESRQPWVLISFTTFPSQNVPEKDDGAYRVTANKVVETGGYEYIFRNMAPKLVGLYAYGGSICGVRYILVQLASDWSVDQLSTALDELVADGLVKSIVSIKEIPSSVARAYQKAGAYLPISQALDPGTKPTQSLTPPVETFSIQRNSALDGYTPMNKKLLTGQFNYLAVTNHVGGNAEYQYEYFDNPASVTFERVTATTADPEVRLVPMKYKKLNKNIGESLMLTGFPNVSFSYSQQANDYSANREANKVSIGNWGYESQSRMYDYLEKDAKYNVGYGGGIIGPELIQNTYSALKSLDLTRASIELSGISSGKARNDMEKAQHDWSSLGRSFIAPVRDHARMPFTSSGVTDASTLLLQDKLDFFAYKMSITSRYARLLDLYFNRVGYATMDIKVPNTHSRANWNYLKMSGSSVHGGIPYEAATNISQLLDRGICFYHNAQTFGKFDGENPITA